MCGKSTAMRSWREVHAFSQPLPAILEDEDWPAWLGEESAERDEVKAVLQTMKG